MGNHKKWAVKVHDNKMYGQQKNYPIGKIGSPKLKLFAERKDVHFSL